MSRPISRRILLGGLAASAGHAALASAPAASIRPQVRSAELEDLARRSATERLVAQSRVRGATGCAVADLRSGEMLEEVDADRMLPPASVAKIVTALYAIDTLGVDHRFRTRVLATAPMVDGRVDGDLILAGGGDPTLDTDGLATLAGAAKAAGLREVTGRLLIWTGALPNVRSIDPGQPDHLGYSPAVDGIALNFNRVHFGWVRGGDGYAVSMDARTGRYRPDVVSSTMRVVQRRLPIYTYADADGVDAWTVASGALGQEGARWLPVRSPGLYAGDVFRTMARSHGIQLPAAQVVRDLPQGTAEVSTISSEPLAVILRDMLKYSNNLTAEMVGLSASAARGAVPVSLAASAEAMSGWATRRYGQGAVALVDHSGLGDASGMSPRAMLAMLVGAAQEGVLRPMLKTIRVRDAQGRIDKSVKIDVAAKTGTLHFVSGLGGYMTSADGTDLAFAIFSADRDTRATLTRAERERPDGARTWNRRAKALQYALIRRWGQVYGS